MDDEELLALVKAERQSAIGLDNDATLSAAREKALNYYKGEMTDIPSLPNRSTAVSTDVSDAIDTLHPDIVEIFTGGDDVMAFIPIGPEDEEGAQQETDYVNHVVFNENPGWQVLHDGTKDALQVKIGVFKAWAEECPAEEETFEGKTAVAMQMAAQDGEITNVSIAEGEDPDNPQRFNFTVERPKYRKVRVACWPPEDFAVASDTGRRLNDESFTYCSARSRPRAQTLLNEGYPEDLVERLSPYAKSDSEGTSTARDTAGEHELTPSSVGNLRRVEIVEHIVRVNDGDKPKLYSVITGENESVFLRKDEIKRNPFSAITPYPVSHRFYGECPADRLIEPQRVKTALLRMMLDSGYFALNQRNEVAESTMTVNTIPDLLNNQPGGIVRVKQSGTVTPLSAGQLGFDVFGAMEYMETRVEQRTGIVRAAQGLAPDTLHETKGGVLALLTAAQKRVKLVARNFAETGIKDLFLNVHALLRENSDKPVKVRLRNKWAEVDPTSWGSRSDMAIQLGLGASGREADIIALQQEEAILEKIVAAQGGAQGPVVGFTQIYNQAKRSLEKLGNKAPEKVIMDPAENPQQPQPPPPDPKLIEAQTKQQEAQAKAQLAQQQAGADHELKIKAADADSQLKVQKAQLDAETQRQLNTMKMQAEVEQAAKEIALKERVMVAELELKREIAARQLELDREANAQRVQVDRENNADKNEATRENNYHKTEVSSDIGDVAVGGHPG